MIFSHVYSLTLSLASQEYTNNIGREWLKKGRGIPHIPSRPLPIFHLMWSHWCHCGLLWPRQSMCVTSTALSLSSLNHLAGTSSKLPMLKGIIAVMALRALLVAALAAGSNLAAPVSRYAENIYPSLWAILIRKGITI